MASTQIRHVCLRRPPSTMIVSSKHRFKTVAITIVLLLISLSSQYVSSSLVKQIENNRQRNSSDKIIKVNMRNFWDDIAELGKNVLKDIGLMKDEATTPAPAPPPYPYPPYPPGPGPAPVHPPYPNPPYPFPPAPAPAPPPTGPPGPPGPPGPEVTIIITVTVEPVVQTESDDDEDITTKSGFNFSNWFTDKYIVYGGISFLALIVLMCMLLMICCYCKRKKIIVKKIFARRGRGNSSSKVGPSMGRGVNKMTTTTTTWAPTPRNKRRVPPSALSGYSSYSSSTPSSVSNVSGVSEASSISNASAISGAYSAPSAVHYRKR